MIYAPHILFVERVTETRDAFNRAYASATWVRVGPCRCDDNRDVVLSLDNSKEYVPKYHIVMPRTCCVRNGAKVRVENPDGTVRGEGTADNVRILNYLDYADFYAG